MGMYAGDLHYISGMNEAADWTYHMRRDMQEVIPGIFLGPYSSAMRSKYESLVAHNITHIVCIRQDIESHFIRPNFPDKFNYLVLDIADSLTENIIQHFPKIKRFLDECLLQEGKALVHGNAGISRSAALVIAYAMEKYGLSFKRAHYMVQKKRFCINPNEGFARQLQEYEPIYQARNSLQNGQTSQTGRLKRRIDDIEDEEDNMDIELPSFIT